MILATELIERLQQLVKEHGDIEVVVTNTNGDESDIRIIHEDTLEEIRVGFQQDTKVILLPI